MKWRKSYGLILVAVALSSAGAWYAWAPRETPPGQPPLLTLTPENFAALQEQFNRDAGAVRLLVLLSPT